MNTVNISTVLAWKLVNMKIVPHFEFPKTPFDSNIGHSDGKISSIFNDNRNVPANILEKLFAGKLKKPITKHSDRASMFYTLLRPEIIFQYPNLLLCKEASDALDIYGEVVELSKDLKFQHVFA